MTKLKIGTREDFGLVRFENRAGLSASFYPNGATHEIRLGDLMVNQMEGHPFDGAMDRVYLRRHETGGITAFSMNDTSATCAFHENGVRWNRAEEGLGATVELVLHPELPILYRICRVTNTGGKMLAVDWMAGQDLGLAEPGTLKSNEAYVCQYLDHKIAVHPVAGKTVLSRNNLHSGHPFALNCCLQGAAAVSTDGYQFFGAASKLDGRPVALGRRMLDDRVKQYEFAYAALQSRKVELQPCQSCVTVFAVSLLAEHPEVIRPTDLTRVDDVLKEDLPEPGAKTHDAAATAFSFSVPFLPVQPLGKPELEELFGKEWRHVEISKTQELYSFFCGTDTHVVFPAKEAAMERQHATILKSAHGAELDENVLSVTCFGFGAFGSQLVVGNTSFGRFTTILRNSLNLDRSSGIRLFTQVSNGSTSSPQVGWKQLGFPSVFVMERDRVRWIYKTEACTFEVVATANSDTIDYSVLPILGICPVIRMTIEVCGDANEFDAAPSVDWNANEQLLRIAPAEGALLKTNFPESCLLAKVNAGEVGGAEKLGGSNEPYVVIDASCGELAISVTGHYDGEQAARQRFEQAGSPGWDSLMSGFRLKPACGATSKLSDTINWYAHNAMIHFSAPRGIEQYGAAAWGTRDVCQGPLEFLLPLGHDHVAADLLCKVFSHQFADSGTWPQWFMFDGFGEIRQHESHGDIVFWPLKALCDYIEQTGDITILDQGIPYDGSDAAEPLRDHVQKAVRHIMDSCVNDTALPSYGDGDWNDSLQPANQAMKTHMVSGWTVGLAYQTLTALSNVWKKVEPAPDSSSNGWKIDELDGFLKQMAADFRKYILKNGVAAGFVRFDGDKIQHMLHPSDFETGIRYRLLPINRSIISGLFTPAEKDFHLGLVDRYLKFPDGVRLMDRPPEYTGGKSVHFQRAETASHFGREIGLQYVHAHIRYCEALARVGRADELLEGLLTVSPVAIQETVPNALPRQANLYFSSSDADVNDRYEILSRMDDLKKGEIGALGGWRLYSSGPGIYIGLVISRLFGIRRSFGNIEIDPVLPKSLDGAELSLDLLGKKIKWIYRVKERSFTPSKIIINGTDVFQALEYSKGGGSASFQGLENPYRKGGVSIGADVFAAALSKEENTVEIIL